MADSTDWIVDYVAWMEAERQVEVESVTMREDGTILGWRLA